MNRWQTKGHARGRQTSATSVGNAFGSNGSAKRDSSNAWHAVYQVSEFIVKSTSLLRVDLVCLALLGLAQVGIFLAALYLASCVVGCVLPMSLLVFFQSARAVHGLRVADAARHTFLVRPASKLLQCSELALEMLLGTPV